MVHPDGRGHVVGVRLDEHARRRAGDGSGPFLDAGPSKLAIVGGTGAYANARGWMELRARNDKGAEYDFVFHVS